MVTHAQCRIILQFPLMLEFNEEGRVITFYLDPCKQVILFLVDCKMVAHLIRDNKSQNLGLMMHHS